MRSVIALASISTLLFACTATPAGQDLYASSNGTSPTPIDPIDPIDPDPPCVSQSCPTGEQTFGTLNACTASGADRCGALVTGCGNVLYCGRFDAQCDAYPECDAGDTQVKSCVPDQDCYSRTICGSTITCRRPEANCLAIPTCDPGDVQITQGKCIADVDCYSRTECGSTIWCLNVK